MSALQLARRIARRLRHPFARRQRSHVEIHWHGANSQDEAARALAEHARLTMLKSQGWIACLGNGGELQGMIAQRLTTARVRFRALSLTELQALPDADIGQLAGIVCGLSRSREIAACASALLRDARLSQTPFEYVAGLDPERGVFQRLDEYAGTFFISPLLRDEIDVYGLYEESLQHFEQKCGLRDYLDLYQMLRHVCSNQVPGDIAEFGSYRGHSGWLIARLVKALGSNKKVYLFDMFEKFPSEALGVDDFWSGTHEVDFAAVQAKFAGMDHVVLVKGDFTETVRSQGPQTMALAYIDCDSYRATQSLIDQLWDARVPRDGIMAFEDYGHLALLGNRLSVDESIRGRGRGFQFFSQFSGIYLAVKTA